MRSEHSAPRVRSPEGPNGAPVLESGHLDALWLQVTGALCNLRCAHCFLSCSPENHAFGFLPFDQIERRLEEGARLGVREHYVTGGEPFLHPRIVDILSLALAYGPTTVLTNGTLLRSAQVRALATAAAASPWSLEFRLSLDGPDAESNDVLRGPGAFRRALTGLDLLLAHGFLPIVTAVQTWPDDEEPEMYARFVALLRERGCAKPRVKTIPAFRIGAEAQRGGGYERSERVSAEMLEGYDVERLVCAHARVVTDRGIWICPILLDSPEGRLGDDLATAARAPFALAHAACHTCWLYGAVCANPGAAAPETAVPSAREAIA